MTTTLPTVTALSARPWQRSPILTPEVLDALHDVNWDFLTTLTRVPRQWHAGRISTRLPDPAYLALVAMDPYRRREAARVPFTLYTARFLDDRFWADVASTPAVPAPVNDDGNEQLRCLREFARVAFFLAWHLARANSPAARLVMGMTGETVEVFRQLSLTKIRQIAIERADLLTPRWADRTSFWKRVLGNAAEQQAGSSLDVGLLGIQMIAGEMVAAAALRDVERRRNEKQSWSV